MNKKSFLFILLLFLFTVGTNQTVLAEEAAGDESTNCYQNPKTKYKVFFEDDADLIPVEKQKDLVEKMKAITQYGHVAFKSITENTHSTESFARDYYYEVFADDSGILFLVDMDNRYLWIYSDGRIYKKLTQDYADTITDNVYRYASKGDYYNCAWNAYDQVYKVLEGQKIAMPMKYICNILLAINLGLFINVALVKLVSKKNASKDHKKVASRQQELRVSNLKAKFVEHKKKYSPRKSRSSGGSSSYRSSSRRSSSRRSSGGSRRSGGGGGHRF